MVIAALRARLKEVDERPILHGLLGDGTLLGVPPHPTLRFPSHHWREL
jgi:hypothetical protein